ncbi:MAG: hypothetical protein ACK5AZ_03405 [Bryobacteraceae bacterium]
MLIISFAVAGTLLWWNTRPVHGAAELLPYLPPSESTILYADFKALRQSGVLDMLAGSKFGEEAEYKDFVHRTGFDFRTDLDGALVSLQDTGTYLVVSGRFRWSEIEKYAAGSGGACVEGLCRVAGSRPDRQISFYLIRPNLLAMAVSPNPYAATLIAPHKIPPGGDFPNEPIWASVPSPVLREKDALPAGTRAFASALSSAERVTFSLGADGARFQAMLQVTCRDREEAASLIAQLEGATSMLRKLIARENQTPNPRDLSGVLTAGTFRLDDRFVYGRWPLERAFLEAVAGGEI